MPVVFFQFKHRVGLSHEVQTRQQLNDDDGQEFRSFHFVIILDSISFVKFFILYNSASWFPCHERSGGRSPKSGELQA